MPQRIWDEARICRDLFGRDLFGRREILRTWGRAGSAMGMSPREPLPDEQACGPALAKIEQRRRPRGHAPQACR